MMRLIAIATILVLAASPASAHSRYTHYTLTSSMASIYSLLFDTVVVPNRFGPRRPRGDFIPSYRSHIWRRA